jgi:colanic acid/amylovoran biosynthesis glycosyltransferase
MADQLSRLGCPEEKIKVQRLGIDCSRIPVFERDFSPGQTLQVLAAARFKEKKGLPDAVRAVALASRLVPVQLTVVGDAAAGGKGRAEKRRLLQAVRCSELAGTVLFTGRLEHSELFRKAYQSHVIIQPSRRSSTGDTEGGVPVTLVELAATGLPAVATWHADIPQVVLHGETGLLAQEGDIETLAGHLVRLAREPGLLSKLGRGAGQHIRRYFDQNRCDLTLRHYYEQVVQRHERAAAPEDGVVVSGGLL